MRIGQLSDLAHLRLSHLHNILINRRLWIPAPRHTCHLPCFRLIRQMLCLLLPNLPPILDRRLPHIINSSLFLAFQISNRYLSMYDFVYLIRFSARLFWLDSLHLALRVLFLWFFSSRYYLWLVDRLGRWHSYSFDRVWLPFAIYALVKVMVVGSLTDI